MATDEEKIEELKNRGNKYMKSTPPDLEKAIMAYTEALNIDEHCHTVLSNRSLAFFKLQKYQEALVDAEGAVKASPKWPKGYLRKCSALNALKKSHEAQQVAQEGFLLMHSTSFCHEFVSQWLKACDDIYTDDKLEELLPYGAAQLFKMMLSGRQARRLIPEGLRILSDDYWKVLFYCMSSRLSPLLALSPEAVKQYLLSFADEFERIMSLFGHVVGQVVKEWATLAGDTVDADLLEQMKFQSTRATDNLVKLLNDDLHPSLFAVARPLLLLAVTVFNTRMYLLNASNTGFHTICHMMSMCLPVFEISILKSPEFVHHHMNVLAGLIDSYNRRATTLMNEECPVLAAHCKKLESLLPVLASQSPNAYQELHKQFEYIIGSAKAAILSKSTGVTIPFPQCGGQSEEDAIESAKKLMATILEKPVELVTISDAERIINLVDLFFTEGDVNQAKKCLVVGEKMLLPLIGVQLQQGGASLEEILSTTRGFRFKVLLAASRLRASNKALLFEMIIRWKGLFSEFRVAAIREGLSEAFLSTSSLFHSLKASGIIEEKRVDQVVSLKKDHQSKVNAFLKDHAYRCWKTVALFPVLPTVQEVLTRDELMIEYSFIGNYDEANLKASLDLYILALKPDGTQELCTVSDRTCVDAIQRWIKQWNVVTAINMSGSDLPAEERKLQVIGKELSSILFPTVVQQHIRHPDVKHIYMCPEPHFSMIPIQLLPGDDERPLFQGRTISYLGSCREIVRMEVMAQLAKEHQQSTETKSASVNRMKDCYVFADPNFDHQLAESVPKGEIDLWEKLCALNPFQAERKICHSLEYSLKEAHSIEEILGLCQPDLKIHLFHGSKANVESVLSLKSPLLVHFSTHGFGRLQFQFDLPNISQDDNSSGLALAGFNTYASENFKHIDPSASTGMLTPLTACGLDLSNTRLVFLSTCVSGVGSTQLEESTNSIANAFRTAGALTVIATSWSVDDDATAEFVKHFYNALCQPETRPSEALNVACEELCKNSKFSSWRHWAGFSCFGDDIPVFSNS